MSEKNKLPAYWRSTAKDLEETLKLVKWGTVSMVSDSAGGRPIYKIEYGKSNIKLGRANLSSARGAHDVRCYADKTGEDYIPTLFLSGSIHGGEFEGTMALLNLIKLLETGTDYAGVEYPELVALMERIHLVIVPIANPDGRARVPFESVVGMTFNEFRHYNQGTWKNGELCGWPGCKRIHPIKDYCDYLGGYFNDDGVNMAHEDFFGEISKESRVLIDICRREVPDLSIQLHGGTNCVCTLLPAEHSSADSYEKCMKFSNMAKDVIEGKGGIPYKVSSTALSDAFSLKSAMHHVCGEPVLTYESNQGLCDHGNIIYTYDEIYKSHLLLFETAANFVLDRYGK